MGAMPTTGSCSNFFVDVTFEPGLRIFTTQTPATTSPAAPGYEVGTQFSANRNGSVKALRFWRAAGETGDTVARLWTDSGTLLAAVTYRDYGTGTSGWQQLAIPPVAITANTRYRVSFNTNHGTGQDRLWHRRGHHQRPADRPHRPLGPARRQHAPQRELQQLLRGRGVRMM